MPLLDRLRGMFTRKAYSTPSPGWYPLVREPFAGAWQRNLEISSETASRHFVNEACKSLIARDIAKLPLRLVELSAGGIWTETTSAAFSPVLRKPNHFQTRNQFWESWMLSKLSRGNTYVLKVRDARRVVVAMYVLDPRRVQVLVARDGSVFYRLDTDELNDLPADVTVPATEIIHDRFNCETPLVGLPPIYSSAMAAMQGLNIQTQSIRLFGNNATPGGILTAPGHIEDDTVARLKTDWEQRFSGAGVGRLAVLGDGLKFEKMSLTAVEGQLIEQLKWTGEAICTSYHVPPFMVGVGAEPSGSAQERTLRYYQQCLQSLIEDAEACLDDGLGLGDRFDLGIEFDVDNLLRMDTVSQAAAVTQLVGGSILTPNEGRRRFNQKPLEGGDTVYMQQQNYSLAALAKRDAQDDPFATATPPPVEQEEEEEDIVEEDDAEEELEATKFLLALHKGFAA